jgi:hypothetical protein
MTDRVEDDIVQRALISLLMPAAAVPASLAPGPVIRKKKFRITNRMHPDAIVTVAPDPPPAHVAVVEARSSKSLTVCWSDARSGHYGDQIWGIGLARMDAYCVLTGLPIRRGDPVFRPRVFEANIPANGNRMILASVIRPDRGRVEHDPIDNAREPDVENLVE